MGEGYGGVEGEREVIYLSLHCHDRNDFCNNVGNDESHFNVTKSRDSVHNFLRERRAETDWNRGPSAYQPNALPLGQTGSPVWCSARFFFLVFSTGCQDRAKVAHLGADGCQADNHPATSLSGVVRKELKHLISVQHQRHLLVWQQLCFSFSQETFRANRIGQNRHENPSMICKRFDPA